MDGRASLSALSRRAVRPRGSYLAGALLALGVALAARPADTDTEPPPPRTLGVTQGPETVFGDAAAIERLVPPLAGAKATGTNGRVGNELVFWGYRLADGRAANLYACALVAGVDCDARRAAICDSPPAVLHAVEAPGDVRRLSCRSVATAAPGDTRPGCDEREQALPLAVGLVQCP